MAHNLLKKKKAPNKRRKTEKMKMAPDDAAAAGFYYHFIYSLLYSPYRPFFYYFFCGRDNLKSILKFMEIMTSNILWKLKKFARRNNNKKFPRIYDRWQRCKHLNGLGVAFSRNVNKRTTLRCTTTTFSE